MYVHYPHALTFVLPLMPILSGLFYFQRGAHASSTWAKCKDDIYLAHKETYNLNIYYPTTGIYIMQITMVRGEGGWPAGEKNKN